MDKIIFALFAVGIFAALLFHHHGYADGKTRFNLDCDGRLIMSGYHISKSSAGRSYTIDGATYTQNDGEVCRFYAVNQEVK